ncbi:agamous-like MADS-box protein AGL27 [Lycium barbarum]|uniref:agamous-like MADS-box protein AGL27 n=1 Tax=Lycium barbarum TaxID=112863 RepID=UPI00293E4730|nr:agamous-like MADS-box protein AGL27 [Lycium barbarum]
MGRKKVEIKRIEDKNSRQATFSKRRNGLTKKAKQLSILCDVDVAVLVFSSRGRLFEFSSTNSLTGIIHRYNNHMKAEDKVSAEVNDTEESKYASFMPMEELLQALEKQIEEPDVDDLSITDLVHLENQVESALTQTRFRKTHLLIESIKNLHDKEKQLIEENKVLEDEIGTIKNKETNEKAVNLNDIPPTRMDCGRQRETLNFL